MPEFIGGRGAIALAQVLLRQRWKQAHLSHVSKQHVRTTIVSNRLDRSVPKCSGVRGPSNSVGPPDNPNTVYILLAVWFVAAAGIGGLSSYALSDEASVDPSRDKMARPVATRCR